MQPLPPGACSTYTPSVHDLQARAAGTLAKASGNAIEFNGRWWTWDEVRRVHERLGDLLQRALPETDVAVGIAIRNRPAHVSAFWSLLAQGRPASFINPFRPAAAVADEIGRLGLAAV